MDSAVQLGGRRDQLRSRRRPLRGRAETGADEVLERPIREVDVVALEAAAGRDVAVRAGNARDAEGFIPTDAAAEVRQFRTRFGARSFRRLELGGDAERIGVERPRVAVIKTAISCKPPLYPLSYGGSPGGTPQMPTGTAEVSHPVCSTGPCRPPTTREVDVRGARVIFARVKRKKLNRASHARPGRGFRGLLEVRWAARAGRERLEARK